MQENREQLSIYVTKELKARIEAAARADGRSWSALVNRILETHVAGGIGAVNTVSNNTNLQTLGDLERIRGNSSGRQLSQVHLEDAIAAAVKRGPVKPSKHK